MKKTEYIKPRTEGKIMRKTTLGKRIPLTTNMWAEGTFLQVDNEKKVRHKNRRNGESEKGRNVNAKPSEKSKPQGGMGISFIETCPIRGQNGALIRRTRVYGPFR